MTSEQLHASAAAYAGRGVLIVGRSGSGKSSLTLQLMAHGAQLVADDRVDLHVNEHRALVACAPAQLAGLIEARGTGILQADALSAVPISLVVDLDHTETERLPQPKSITILSVTLPCLHRPQNPAFPYAVLQYLKAGRAET